MRVRYLLIAATALASVSPAAAVPLLFELTGSRNASFTLDSSETPDFFNVSQSQFFDVAGIYNGVEGVGTINFSNAFFGGFPHFEIVAAGLGFSQFTSVTLLFDGPTSDPMFRTGVFPLTSIVSGNSVLTVSEVAVIPEPATWAMLVIGFGLIGAATRRRQRAVAV